MYIMHIEHWNETKSVDIPCANEEQAKLLLKNHWLMISSENKTDINIYNSFLEWDENRNVKTVYWYDWKVD